MHFTKHSKSTIQTSSQIFKTGLSLFYYRLNSFNNKPKVFLFPMQSYQPRSQNRDFLRTSQLFNESSILNHSRTYSSSSTNSKKFLKVYSNKRSNSYLQKNDLKQLNASLPVRFDSTEKEKLKSKESDFFINKQANPYFLNPTYSHDRINSYQFKRNEGNSFIKHMQHSLVVKQRIGQTNPEIQQAKGYQISFPSKNEILRMQRFRHTPSPISALSSFPTNIDNTSYKKQNYQLGNEERLISKNEKADDNIRSCISKEHLCNKKCICDKIKRLSYSAIKEQCNKKQEKQQNSRK